MAAIVGGSTPPGDDRFWGGPITWYTPTDVAPLHAGTLGESARTLTEAGLAACSASVVPAGTVVVTSRAPIGNVALTDRPAATNQGCKTLVPFNTADARFIGYVLQASIGALISAGTGTTFQEISGERLGRLSVPTTSPEAQRLIADFLDREAGRIEAMHRGLDQGLMLIDDQRSAVVEALTQAPPIPLKYALVRIEQGWSPDCEATLAQPGAWGVLKAGAPNYATFWPEEHKALPSNLEPVLRLEVRPGDVLMSRANTRALAGSAAVVESTGGWRLMLCDKLYRLVVRAHSYRPHYLIAALASRRVRDQIEMATAGASASMQNISQELVRGLQVPCPTLETQAQAEAKLAIDWRRRETLLAHLKTLGQRLAEYRDALITEAVTGRLDVTRRSDSQLDESAHAAMDGERPEVLPA